MVKLFIPSSQLTQYLQRLLGRVWLDHHLLKATRQGAVLLNALAILIQCGGSDHLYRATRQSRLEHVRGIHTALSRASAHQRVDLVKEQDRIAQHLSLLE